MSKTIRTLILCRHAKSEPFTDNASDFERALTKEGKECAAFMAKKLKSALSYLALDGDAQVICSEAKRTQQTWQAMAPHLTTKDSKDESGAKDPGALDADVNITKDLYDESAQNILKILQNVDDNVNTVMTVGHNPGTEEVAHILSSDTNSSDRELLRYFSTASILILQFKNLERWDDLGEIEGKVANFLEPKKLGWSW